MAVNNIYIGSTTDPSFFFTNEQLIDVSSSMSVDAIGNELTIDTLEFKVYYDDSDGSLRALTYATPILYYNGNDLVGKFYFKSIERVGAKYYVINAVSAIGLLEYEKHYGGMFVGKNVKQAIIEAITTDGFPPNNPTDITFYEYARASNVGNNNTCSFRQNNRGESADESGTNTAVHIEFVVNQNPLTWDSSWTKIWYNSVIVETTEVVPATGKYYRELLYGIQLYPISSTTFSMYVYCSYKDDINGAIFNHTVSIGDYIKITFHPKFGKIYYKINNSLLFTAITTPLQFYNYILPLYTLVGVSNSWDSSTQAVTSDYLYRPSIDYSLYRLCFFNHDGSSTASLGVKDGDEVYFDLQIGKNSLNTSYFHDKAKDTYVQTDYSCGGNVTGDNVTTLARIAKNINWQQGVENLTFSGWIPSGTRRGVLHQILFAMNLNMFKDQSGNPVIGMLPLSTDREISDSEIYNSGSVEEVKKPRVIELTENAYNAPSLSDPLEDVFDNSSVTTPDGKYIVEFNNAPIYGTPTATGLTILQYNANAAEVTGKGKIQAKVYKKYSRILSEIVGERPDGETVSVSDAPLVTFLNAANVMNKLKAYYANNVYKIKNSIIAGGEALGRKYTLNTPFNEEADAYLVSANVIGSSVTKLNCEFLANYTPVGIGPVYSHCVLLTGVGTWTAPIGTERIHVVLIGGGSGGDSGYAGEDGKSGRDGKQTYASEGGNYGENGENGKIFSIDIDDSSLGYAFSYSCGTGGDGGEICYSHEQNNAGSPGTATTFTKNGGTSYTSADGQPSAEGYTDPLTGNVYCNPMLPWNEASGKGGCSGWHDADEEDSKEYVTYHRGETVTNFLTGESYEPGDINAGEFNYWYYYDARIRALGEFAADGGGSAIAQKGSNGCRMADINSPSDDAFGGDGANATFVPPNPLTQNPRNYGSGGMGGAGGGGGGSGGYVLFFPGDIPDDLAQSTPGHGGYGGEGGDGGDGCILVYY